MTFYYDYGNMTIVMHQAVSKSQFKAQALEYLREVEKNKHPLIITHEGKPVIKVIPYKEENQEVAIRQSLKGSVLRYDDPNEPVIDPDDWDMLK